jgi:hypothetical protein
MGMIRGTIDTTSSMEDIVSRGARRDPAIAGDRTPPTTGRECHDPVIDTIVGFDQARDSSRSRGYGRYEI